MSGYQSENRLMSIVVSGWQSETVCVSVTASVSQCDSPPSVHCGYTRFCHGSFLCPSFSDSFRFLSFPLPSSTLLVFPFRSFLLFTSFFLSYFFVRSLPFHSLFACLPSFSFALLFTYSLLFSLFSLLFCPPLSFPIPFLSFLSTPLYFAFFPSLCPYIPFLLSPSLSFLLPFDFSLFFLSFPVLLSFLFIHSLLLSSPSV